MLLQQLARPTNTIIDLFWIADMYFLCMCVQYACTCIHVHIHFPVHEQDVYMYSMCIHMNEWAYVFTFVSYTNMSYIFNRADPNASKLVPLPW